MFIKSFKVSGRRLAGIGVMCAVLLALAVYGVGTRLEKPGASGEGVPTSVKTDAKTDKRAAKGIAKTEADRQAFIAQFGWEIDAEPEEIAEVLIPEEFDEVYIRYNELQKQQGYDLEKCRGKRCKRYTYAITNYPDVKGNVRCSLLVLDGKVVGGDVSSTAANGFMHGFTPNSQTMATTDFIIPTDGHSDETVLAEASAAAQEAGATASEPSIEETMAAELAAMERDLLQNIPATPPTEDVMPTD